MGLGAYLVAEEVFLVGYFHSLVIVTASFFALDLVERRRNKVKMFYLFVMILRLSYPFWTILFVVHGDVGSGICELQTVCRSSWIHLACRPLGIEIHHLSNISGRVPRSLEKSPQRAKQAKQGVSEGVTYLLVSISVTAFAFLRSLQPKICSEDGLTKLDQMGCFLSLR